MRAIAEIERIVKDVRVDHQDQRLALTRRAQTRGSCGSDAAAPRRDGQAALDGPHIGRADPLTVKFSSFFSRSLMSSACWANKALVGAIKSTFLFALSARTDRTGWPGSCPCRCYRYSPPGRACAAPRPCAAGDRAARLEFRFVVRRQLFGLAASRWLSWQPSTPKRIPAGRFSLRQR